jgi:hypothetical protein
MKMISSTLRLLKISFESVMIQPAVFWSIAGGAAFPALVCGSLAMNLVLD